MKAISYEYSRVLKHRLKKGDPDITKLRQLCESGFISKEAAKVIAEDFKEKLLQQKKDINTMVSKIKT